MHTHMLAFIYKCMSIHTCRHICNVKQAEQAVLIYLDRLYIVKFIFKIYLNNFIYLIYILFIQLKREGVHGGGWREEREGGTDTIKSQKIKT